MKSTHGNIMFVSFLTQAGMSLVLQMQMSISYGRGGASQKCILINGNGNFASVIVPDRCLKQSTGNNQARADKYANRGRAPSCVAKQSLLLLGSCEVVNAAMHSDAVCWLIMHISEQFNRTETALAYNF